MGGCATKPKVLTGDGEAEAPPPAPEPAKDEISAAPAPEPAKVEEAAAAEVKTETKEKGVEVVEEEKKVVEGDGSVKEIVGEHEDKPRSLSNLFKENEGKDGEAEAEPVKQEEVFGTGKPKEESETKKLEAQPSSEPAKDEVSEPEKPSEERETKVVAVIPEAVNTEAPVEVEQTIIPAVVTEKVVDVTPTLAETQRSEEKKTEESK